MNKAVPEPVNRLIDAFAQLPGIGQVTASRLTYFLLRAPDDVSARLAEAVGELKSKTRLCSICYNITEEDPCAICRDPQRDISTLAVVEEPLDVIALEKAGIFKGRYHVLHGVISPRQGIGIDELKIRELVKRIDDDHVQELIIATNPGQEGDSTAMSIQQELLTHGSESAKAVKLTRLARGLPTGGHLQYVDPVTIMRALQGRQAL